MSRYLNKSLLLLFAVLVLAACGTLSSDPDAIETAQKLLEEQKNEFGEPRKINFPIELNYTITKKPLVNHDMAIDLEFVAKREIDRLRVGVVTSDGLELVSGDELIKTEKMKAGQVLPLEIVVDPKAEEQYYIKVYMVTEKGEESLARLVSIPISLGKYMLERRPKVEE